MGLITDWIGNVKGATIKIKFKMLCQCPIRLKLIHVIVTCGLIASPG